VCSPIARTDERNPTAIPATRNQSPIIKMDHLDIAIYDLACAHAVVMKKACAEKTSNSRRMLATRKLSPMS
jgi:hypothetical protein